MQKHTVKLVVGGHTKKLVSICLTEISVIIFKGWLLTIEK